MFPFSLDCAQSHLRYTAQELSYELALNLRTVYSAASFVAVGYGRFVRGRSVPIRGGTLAVAASSPFSAHSRRHIAVVRLESVQCPFEVAPVLSLGSSLVGSQHERCHRFAVSHSLVIEYYCLVPLMIISTLVTDSRCICLLQ